MSALDRMKRLVGLNGRVGANLIGQGASGHSNHHHNSAPASTTDELEYCTSITIDPDPPPLVDPCAANIEGATPPSSSKAPFTRGHRRRSTHVTRRDLEKFQKEVLGVEHHASWYDEDNGTSRPLNPDDPQLEELNRAFALADMSMNGSTGMSGNSSGSGMFSGYAENNNAPVTPSMGSVSRQSMPSALSHPSAPVNGSGIAAMNSGMSMNAGRQMDLHRLYEMVLELSDVLKNNREVTKSIVSSAEEIMVLHNQRP